MTTGMMALTMRRHRRRLQLQILGADEPQESLHDFVEPADLRRDDREVLHRERQIGGAELLLEQLEVDDRRVQRVLHFVRDAGRQPAERGELLRVAERGSHLGHVVQVARDEHHRGEPLIEAVDDVREDQPFARRRQAVLVHAIGREAREVRRDRAVRLVRRCRLFHGLPVRMPRRKQIAHRARHRVGRSGGRMARIAWLANSSFASASKIATASSSGFLSASSPLPSSAGAGRRAVGGQTGADGVEEIAELAELVALRQIHDHPELALAQPREAAADDVNRTKRQLCQQHRDEASANQDRDCGDQRRGQRLCRGRAG